MYSLPKIKFKSSAIAAQEETDLSDHEHPVPAYKTQVTVIKTKTPSYNELGFSGLELTQIKTVKDEINEAEKDETDVNEDSQTEMLRIKKKRTIAIANKSEDQDEQIQFKNSRKGITLLETQYDKIEDHLKNVKFEIPTNELYEIYDSCNYNTENEFCPVLLRLGQQMIETSKLRPYLLQVWSNQG